jgi:hypothetical protein
MSCNEENEDEVLSLCAESSDSRSGEEFEGFEEADLPPEIVVTPAVGAEIEVQDSPVKRKKKSRARVPKKLKSVVTKKSTAKSKTKSQKSKKKKSDINLEDLSPHDIGILKTKLGLNNKENSQSFRNRPNLRVEVNPDDISLADSDDCFTGNFPNEEDRRDLEKALFGDDDENSENDDEWDLPQILVSEKGPSIDKNLAKLVNSSCTTQSSVSDILHKYNVPENCDFLAPPSVNLDVWKVLGKKGQSQDRCLVDIQNIVAAEMVAVVKLASVLKHHIKSNVEAKSILTDLISLTGQVQFNLSLRRRYQCRPFLNKKYTNLCNINVPITTKLFGDDLAKEVKNCDVGFSLAKEKYGTSYYGPQRSFRGRGVNYRGRRPNRFQPYGQQYGRQQYSQQQYGQQNPLLRRGRARASATVSSAPN